MNANEQKDIALTPAGMPTLVVGEIEYPLFFAVAGIKAFAERKGVSFKEMVGTGWKAQELDVEDLEFLLTEALNGAERRRQAFRPGPARTVDQGLVDKILTLYHISDIWAVLLKAWSHAPGTPQDPPSPTPSPDGEPSSD